MPLFFPRAKREPFPHEIDLSQILIARDQQLYDFQEGLNTWKELIREIPNPDLQMREAPSRNNKIQGFVCLLYGDSGFGKSTLLRHYREIASGYDYHLEVSDITDWETVARQYGMLRVSSHEIDKLEYFNILRGRFAITLDKSMHDFKEYRNATNVVKDVKMQADRALHNVLKDDRYAALRRLAEDGAIKLLQRIFPSTGQILTDEKVKEYLGESIDIGVKHLSQLSTKLVTKLGENLDDCLKPELRLGLALGRDLRYIARNFPVLVFFDAYETIYEHDAFLRIVMGAAGVRVGWIIAGRGDLWNGPEQAAYSICKEEPYKDIVHTDRVLPLKFGSQSLGFFDSKHIKHYFAQLRKQRPSLPAIHRTDAEHIQLVTQGVPLAVRVVADLYATKPDLRAITEGIHKMKLLDKMMQLYLLHAPNDPDERGKLYGLALLRRVDDPKAVIGALGLSSEEKSSYGNQLVWLQRRYSFVATQQGQPILHREVRSFLRQWLLAHRNEPEVTAVIQRIQETHLARLAELEKRRLYRDLPDRLGDDDWTEVYLDLIEVQFWFDIYEGIRYSLTFLLASAIYRCRAGYEVVNMGEYFEHHMKGSYGEWWRSVAQGWVCDWTGKTWTNDIREGLEKLGNRIKQGGLVFPPSLSQNQQELEAALWWWLGEAYRNYDEQKALLWYREACLGLSNQSELRTMIAESYWKIAYKQYEQKAYAACIRLLDEAITLKTDYVDAYHSRGNAYYELGQYWKAIRDQQYAISFDETYAYAYINLGNAYYKNKRYQEALHEYKQALELIADNADIYYNRALTYVELKNYPKALKDFEKALEQEPNLADVYVSRGNVYAICKEQQKAIADYNRAFALKPRDINIAWMALWASFDKTPMSLAIADRLDEIARLEPSHYIAYVCRGIAMWQRNELEAAQAHLDLAICKAPEEWDPHFWKGMICAYSGQTSIARYEIQEALQLDLPSLLLMPLYWLTTINADFFKAYGEPLLKNQGF
ncbi:MAG TPA: tetratricopeptide repeat protein [Ktedonobacteraceae bacterium]|jgi:tetratricopeptide (TPR) repeat protein